MPDGVLVLSAHAVEVSAEWFVVAMPILVIVGLMAFSVAVAYDIPAAGAIFGACGLGVIVLLSLYGCGVACHYDHTEYQVTLSDSVTVNELLDRYEIVSQDGLIYTIKERSETDEK